MTCTCTLLTISVSLAQTLKLRSDLTDISSKTKLQSLRKGKHKNECWIL